MTDLTEIILDLRAQLVSRIGLLDRLAEAVEMGQTGIDVAVPYGATRTEYETVRENLQWLEDNIAVVTSKEYAPKMFVACYRVDVL